MDEIAELEEMALGNNVSSRLLSEGFTEINPLSRSPYMQRSGIEYSFPEFIDPENKESLRKITELSLAICRTALIHYRLVRKHLNSQVQDNLTDVSSTYVNNQFSICFSFLERWLRQKRGTESLPLVPPSILHNHALNLFVDIGVECRQTSALRKTLESWTNFYGFRFSGNDSLERACLCAIVTDTFENEKWAASAINDSTTYKSQILEFCKECIESAPFLDLKKKMPVANSHQFFLALSLESFLQTQNPKKAENLFLKLFREVHSQSLLFHLLSDSF